MTAYRASTDESGTAHGVGARPSIALLALGALGVVYGDIGTSPLYAVKECFTLPHGVPATPANVLGILSLIVWSLTLVIVVKYLSFIMRADNNGEGGTLALLALVAPRGRTTSSAGRIALVMLGLFGTSLLYGEGIITPAISVLSAVEGLKQQAHESRLLERAVVPITVVILLAVFLVQKRGTAGVGRIFGPATLAWFVAIAAIAVPWIAREPRVLKAVDPRHAVAFMAHNKLHGFLVLGSVVLCITGGEALYADMGHFGKKPIRVAWYAVVFPALLANYFGQGAMLLSRCGGDVRAEACRVALLNPFYALVSGWLVYPMVFLATAATIVASQALISGAYSLTQQAVQLGYSPRLNIVHTSGEAAGQIYVPSVNWALMIACITLVLVFRESTHLAAAYGIAVTGTMSITSILFFAIARGRWKWPLWKAAGLVALFLSVDLTFFAANVAKITHGGWLPVAVAMVIFTLMTTWKRGRQALQTNVVATTLPMDLFMDSLREEKPPRVKGTAVFMTQNPDGAPPALVHHFKHNKVLHNQVVLLTVRMESVPVISADERVEVGEIGEGFWKVLARYGFMQTPDVGEVLRAARARGLETVASDTSFFLGRETLLTTGRSGMPGWRKALFAFMSRNARPATTYFGIPPNRVVELGTQIEL